MTRVSISFSMLMFQFFALYFLVPVGIRVFQMIWYFDRCSNLNLNHCVRCVPTKNHCLNLFASKSVSSTSDRISLLWTTLIYPTLSVLLVWPVCHSLRCCRCPQCDFAQRMDSLGFCKRFAVVNLIFLNEKRIKRNEKTEAKLTIFENSM